MLSVKDFLKKANAGPVVRSSVPMGLGASLPVLSIVSDHLLVSVFYYRCVPRPNDGTLIMPPDCALALDYPSGRLASFEALRMSPRATGVDFERPVGTFRHEAIRHLDREGYQAKKDELFALLDKLVAHLGGSGDFGEKDEEALRDLYRMLAEPSLLPAYRTLSPQFFSRYLDR